ncbi:OsmC family protein [Xylella taiwanensis]|uniref:OsmC family protein n=1 Tax=Xylella taiwanensis TaxID=1444770 RepID=Z9JL58_9GAMM|nr:OsmC family protein [Xylella taiwanensis]AXI82791.1 hypothetical protein AB672_01855 [Xylella taiwanensis]EWS78521.1 OsmC family protein [Xylella taiwanensis]MCD8455801.1 OsmC family protein [Xylella taiwanensis]MCD8458206.1 OsmC family protein [Xylella taiwanensis]MCD8460342.1 OsmC family protein [Xylella taiwanensis]
MTTTSLNGVDLNVLAEAGKAGRANREATKFTLSLNGTWNGGSKLTATTGAAVMGGQRDEARAGRFTLVSDEPVPLGTDAGPNSVEYLLQALASCYTVGIAMIAAQRGIALEGVRLELEADVDPSVPPGVNQVRVKVHAKSPNASHEQLQAMIAAVEQASTLRDTLVRPVDVITTFAD